MHSMLLTLALLQHSHKNLAVNHILPALFTNKSSLEKLSSFHLFGKTFRSPALKSLSSCEIDSHVLDSWYYVEKYQRKRVACYYYQNLGLTNFLKQELHEGNYG